VLQPCSKACRYLLTMFAHSFVPRFCRCQRVNSGRDQGAYYHNLFLRGRPDWVNYIRRQKVRNSDPPRQVKQAIKSEGSNTESSPPNFYQTEFCFYSCVSPLDIYAVDNPATTTTRDLLGCSADNDKLVGCLAWGMASLTNDPLLAEAKASGFMEQPWGESGADENVASKEHQLPVSFGSTCTSDASHRPPTSKWDTDTTISTPWSSTSCLSSLECSAARPQPHPSPPRSNSITSTGSCCHAISPSSFAYNDSSSATESPSSVRLSLSAMSLANNDARPFVSIPEWCIVHDQSPPSHLDRLPRPRPSTLEVQTRNDDSLASTGQDPGLVRGDRLENPATSSSSSSSSFVCFDRQGDLVEFEGCPFHFVEYNDRDLDVEHGKRIAPL
jgi:hypothetical protein